MEGLPTVISVVDSGGGGGGVISGQENLAFAVSEENGLNYGYIIHLPVDVAMQQELLAVGNVLTTDQNHLIVHQDHNLETKHSQSQQSTIYLPVVTTTSTSSAINNCGDSDTATQTVAVHHHHQSSQNHHLNHHHHHPIQFQYHLEEIPSSAFIDGQVQVEMGAEVDVKYDTLNFTSVQLQQEVSEDSQHVNLSDELVSEILSDNSTTSIIDTSNHHHHQQISQVKTSDSPVVSKPITTATTATTTASAAARTYGKPKPVKIISEDSSQAISQPKNLSSPLKVTKVSQVSVKQSQRVTVPSVSVRKRRLILDPQRQIPIPEFKRQLLNTKDIVHVTSELAPGTKQAMKCLELGGVVQFFSTPGRAIRNIRLSRLFTNHLVMISNSVGHGSSNTTNSSFNNVVPLNADLRVPCVVKDEEDNPKSCSSKGHPTNSNVPSTPYKRLINASRPLDCLFKGLRKPPVFKEYKKVQGKFPDKMNGSGLKSFHNRQRNKVKVEEDKNVNKVEEVVYTVVEEEGESVVLKSSHQEVEQDVGGDIVGVGSDVGTHGDDDDQSHDPLLLELKHEDKEELKKESEEDNCDNLFSDCGTTSTFSMVNGENSGGEGEDDLNKLLWSEQVTTSS